MRAYKYKYNMNFVSVILNNKFLDEALKDGPLPVWMVRRINEGALSGKPNSPEASRALNWRTYHN